MGKASEGAGPRAGYPRESVGHVGGGPLRLDAVRGDLAKERARQRHVQQHAALAVFPPEDAALPVAERQRRAVGVGNAKGDVADLGAERPLERGDQLNKARGRTC